MAKERRSRRRWAFLVVVGIAAAIAGGLYLSSKRFKAAEFTPGDAAVDALRQSVKGANIVILVLDATRADHLGCYGYPRETTPNIDRLATSSVLFERHFSQSAETKSSTACLLTSQYCDTNLADGPRAFIPGTFTMEAGLEAAGFSTLLVSSNLKACPLYGIGDDFQDSVWDRQLEALAEEGEERYDPRVALRAFGNWLEDHPDPRFFAYLHLLPPHYPYGQPEEFTHLFAGLEPVKFEPGGVPFPERIPKPMPEPPPLPEWINLYDANLRYADWAVGEVERLLRHTGTFENTLFIVTSDHGEGFGEHGHVWHGRSPYDEGCHIPLVVRFPGEQLAGRRIGALTESVDVLPTLFDLVMAGYPSAGIQGQSLVPLLAGSAESISDYVYCRVGGGPSKYLVRSEDYALILYSNGEWRAFYDLGNDPGQRENVIAASRDLAEPMVAAFEQFAREQRRPPLDFLDPDAVMSPLPEVPAIALSPEDRARVNRIADLGYLR